MSNHCLVTSKLEQPSTINRQIVDVLYIEDYLRIASVEDARKLTQRFGGNPNNWSNVSKYLPLLSKKKYYQSLKHGYARGYEPVIYVKRIQAYLEILRLKAAFKIL